MSRSAALEIPGIGKASILPKTAAYIGGAGGFRVSHAATLRKIMQNTEVQKLEVIDDIQGYLDELDKAGIAVCYGRRDTKLTSSSWPDKTPMPATLVYLSAFPKGACPEKIFVSRKIHIG